VEIYDVEVSLSQFWADSIPNSLSQFVPLLEHWRMEKDMYAGSQEVRDIQPLNTARGQPGAADHLQATRGCTLIDA
jgi:hypothetical protein